MKIQRPTNRSRRPRLVNVRAHPLAAVWLALMLLLVATPHATSAAERRVRWPWAALGAKWRPRTSVPIHGAGVPADCQLPPGTFTSLAKCVDKDKNVVIGEGATESECRTNVVVDQSAYTLGKITIGIGGVLRLPEQTAQLPVSIKTTGIEIDGGTLQIGDPKCAIGSLNPMTRVTINLTGRRPSSCPPGGNRQCPGDVKGIQVENGGTLKLYGAKGVPPQGVSWTTLSAAAGPEDARYDAASGAGTPVPTGGSTTLQLADDVTQGTGSLRIGAWRDGDWIAVATTSSSPFETEFVQIDHVTPTAGGGSQVTLKQPLRHYHFGGAAPTPSQLCTDRDGKTKRLACGATDPTCVSLGRCESVPSSFNYQDGALRNFGVDERAEVGLISRNIKLTSETLPFWTPNKSYQTGSMIRVQVGSDVFEFDATSAGKSGPSVPSWPTREGATVCDSGMGPSCTGGVLWKNAGLYDAHWGGEVRIHEGSEVALQGVELEKFGKDQLGSYPIHFHMVGDASAVSPPVVIANSIHHSYNKCVAVHSSSNLTLQDNVCARIVGHIFYEETGDEKNVVFKHNLALGAMSNHFGIATEQLKTDFWWIGDNLTNRTDQPPPMGSFNGYDGLNIPNTDNQKNPTRGSCAEARNDGGLIIKNPPYTTPHPCSCAEVQNPAGNACVATMPGTNPQFYFEPASGFWIVNPTAVLEGNSVAGCQGVGRGYWYVSPKGNGPAFKCLPAGGCTAYDGPASVGDNKFLQLGTFNNNRVHGCYSGLYDEGEDGVFSEQLFPHAEAIPGQQPADAKPLVATFDGLTATRNRDRGVWIRPTWFVIKNGRFATGRDNVTLVSSGGLDGNAPGVWALLQSSVVVGLSRNNVDRFGPCRQNAGFSAGCIDRNPQASDELGRGYQTPAWNSLGYLIYDGPIRIFGDRFVNFKRDITPLLTNAEQTYLRDFRAYSDPAYTRYEGDAVFGWFNSNQSAYPTATISKELTFENVDLRHQIFTERVKLAFFNDGDQNTAILDEDGTLSGFKVVDKDGGPTTLEYPISLNNLGFNHASNSVDECLSEGQQDSDTEKRPTSLMSAANMATLEFGALWPPRVAAPGPDPGYSQEITFTKDSLDYAEHQQMTLVTGRNGQGVWEPKVASGFGYTITAAPGIFPAGAPLPTPPIPICAPDGNMPGKVPCLTGTGIPTVVDVGFTDAVKPSTSQTTPFFVRVGICYTSTDQTHRHPADPGMFTISRGYKSYGGGNVSDRDTDLRLFWNKLENRYQGQTCNNLDVQVPNNLPSDPSKGCPADGVTGVPPGGCPQGSTLGTAQDGTPACIYPKMEMTSVYDDADCCPQRDISCIRCLKNGDLPVLDQYFYDPATGWLFFNVVQEFANPIGPSPLGSCAAGSPDPCPNTAKKESYYACPAQGCPDYIVRLNDPNYTPGESDCADPYPAFAQNAPTGQNQLAYFVPQGVTPPNGIVDGQIVTPLVVANPGFPHSQATLAPWCPVSP